MTQAQEAHAAYLKAKERYGQQRKNRPTNYNDINSSMEL